MKDVNLLVWLTQLGISVAAPLVLLILLAIWLRDHWGWGDWIVVVGVILGVICAVDGLRVSLKILSKMAKDKKEDTPPPLSYNDHE